MMLSIRTLALLKFWDFFCLLTLTAIGLAACNITLYHQDLALSYPISHRCRTELLHTTMAAPRIISRGRCALAKRMIPCIRSSVLPSFRTAFPQRQFASSSILRLATIETPSGGSEVPPTEARTTPPESIARSIALLRIPKRASRAEVEALIQSHGFDMYVRKDEVELRAELPRSRAQVNNK